MTVDISKEPLSPITSRDSADILAVSQPFVSIILATYNERENILDTIENIFRFVTFPLEIIVVDDDSPDQT